MKQTGKPQRKLVGIRVEPKVAKLMKAVADLQNLPLGELLEQVFADAIEGRSYLAPKGRVPADRKAQYAHLKQAFGIEQK